MNHKQKLGYMALGALIMLIGMGVGSTFFTPPIEAQSNGLFNEITCRKLTVVDKNGKRAIELDSNDKLGNGISIYDQNEKTAIWLKSADYGNGISIYNPNRISFGMIELNSFGTHNVISINRPNGKEAIKLDSSGFRRNGISIYDQNEKTAIALSSYNAAVANSMEIYDENGKVAFEFNAYTHTNELSVHNKSDGAGIGFYADYNEAKQTTWRPKQEE